ncbi:MAG: ATP-binding cassette domain-containing protein [Myxococcaceae bacterium]|nr:ATP-binding cassette domain-containing protein [Myxococcaceae bacterium]
MAPPLLELIAAAKRYPGITALDGVDLALRAGEHVAFLGPSGAGKSTLLRLLNTSAAPSSGAVRFEGRDVATLGEGELRAVRRRIGTIYQQYLLVPQLSVLDNVRAGRVGSWGLLRTLWPVASRAEREEIHALLARVGLAEKLYERADRLSGGQQQRVAIARAVYQRPDVLVADEPLAALDPTRAEELLELLLSFADEGITFCLTSHDLDVVLRHFPRVVGLREGKIAFDVKAAGVSREHIRALYASPRAVGQVPRAPPSVAAVPLPAGGLTIGAASAPLEALVPRALAAFRKEQPAIRVGVRGGPTVEQLDALAQGRIELALVGLQPEGEKLGWEPIAEDVIVLVASPHLRAVSRRSLSLAEVSALPRVERPRGSATRELVEACFARAGTPLREEVIVAEVDGAHALRAAVAEGLGCAFFSQASVAAELSSGKLVELRLELSIRRELFVAWRAGEALTPEASAFLNVLRALSASRALAVGEAS